MITPKILLEEIEVMLQELKICDAIYKSLLIGTLEEVAEYIVFGLLNNFIKLSLNGQIIKR